MRAFFIHTFDFIFNRWVQDDFMGEAVVELDELEMLIEKQFTLDLKSRPGMEDETSGSITFALTLTKVSGK